MKLKQLIELLNSEPIENADLEIKIWLPGSTISLTGEDRTLIRRGDTLMVEGNLDPGSALEVAAAEMLRRF